MKLINKIALASVLALGYANAQNHEIDMTKKKIFKAEYGYLVVQTAIGVEKLEFNNEVKTYKYYKSYIIMDAEGSIIKKVPKNYNAAEKIKLPAGKYVIIAEVINGYKDIFEILIENGKIFEIDRKLINHELESDF